MEENNRAKTVAPHKVPTADEAVQLYEQDGGTLTLFGDFGVDPLGELDDEGKRQERVRLFAQRFPSFELLFHRLVNGNSSLFKEAILYFMQITFLIHQS